MSVEILNANLIHDSTARATPYSYSNIVDTAKQSGATISCNIYKAKSAYSPYGPVPWDVYIRGSAEPNAGAHYYARSYPTTTYASASCTIPLGSISASVQKGLRTGFIEIGTSSEGSKYHNCDVGLAYDGTGWYPHVWSQGFLNDWNPSGATSAKPNLVHRDDKNLPIYIITPKVVNSGYDTKGYLSGSGNVTVLVEIGSTSAVDWIRVTFTYNGKTGKIALNCPLGTMFKRVSGSPETRFNRFMSLVPDSGATSDNADNSKLTGRMNNLKLGSTAWTDDKIQFAWAMQMNNIEAIRIGTLAQSGGSAATDYAVLHHVNQNH